MRDFRRILIGRIGAKRALATLAVAAFLTLSSVVAAVGLSEGPSGATLVITSVANDPDQGYVGQPVEWTVVVEAQDQGQLGKGLLFTWDWGDGNQTVHHLKSLGPNSTATDTQSHTWSGAGRYKVVVSVWDGYDPEQSSLHNASARTWFTVMPSSGNTPPVAAFDVVPDEGTVDTVFLFDATTSSDPEDPPEALEIRWDWESDGMWDTDYSHEKNAEHVFEVPELYTVSLEVIDSGGMTAITSRNVSVFESPVLLPHAPIHIEGDLEFITTAASESWAGNGTSVDPFVIELYEFVVGGTENHAIWVQNTTVHFIIRGCEFSQVDGSAIHLNNVVYASVDDNLFWSCQFYSIYYENSEDLSITGNTIAGGSHCIGIIDCQNVFIGYNLVEDSDWWPLCMVCSTGVTMKGNIFQGSGIQINGYSVSHWNTHDIDDSNRVNGHPVYYFKDQQGGSVPQQAGQIILANCMDMLLQSSVSGSISLGFSTGNTITGSAVSSVHIGITLSFSTGTTIESTSIHQCDYGIKTSHAIDTRVMSSTISKCGYGMWIQGSDSPTIVNNSVLDSKWYGVFLYYSSFGHVRHNLIAGGLQEGLYLVCANSNLIVSNNFVDNAIQAAEHYTSTDNRWDDGYPYGGNYWSDYQGVDEYSGVDQSEPGPDGIGDTPYVLSSGSRDNYPLMEPCEDPSSTTPVASFVVSVDGLTVSVDASQSYDPDGTIVSFDWDWGDGTNGTGETASHTYVAPETVTAASDANLGVPQFPHPIVGYTTDVNANPLPFCTVTVTNVRLNLSAVVESNADGVYQVELANMDGEYEDGDEILVEAVKGDMFGSAVGYVDVSNFYDVINVTLYGEAPPPPFEVTITLTVTDADGLTGTMTRTVTLYP